MKEPYIGITGFTQLEEVETLGGFARQIEPRVMFGYLASKKRLENPVKSGTRSVALIDLPGLVGRTPEHIFPMIHYHSPSHDTLAQEVGRVFNLLYETRCRAVQLNQDWPKPLQIELMKKNIPELEVVLQLPKVAMDDAGTISNIASRTRAYEGLVDYVLIDPSGGKGQEVDIGRTIALLHAVNEELPQIRIGYAGGLSAENVSEVTTKIKELFNQTAFIDAESNLRRKDRNKIHLTEAHDYMNRANL